MSKIGQTLNTPEDVLKEPYVFEFLGVKENSHFRKSFGTKVSKAY